MGRGPQLASAAPADEVSPGTIQVLVVDGAQQPLARVDLDVGIMGSMGASRDRRGGTTDENGVALFEGLATGTNQSYRVNVRVDGAKYSSNPFQLPPDRGYSVRIMRLPTTRDASNVFQAVAATMLELRDNKVHVVQQTRFMNIGAETYVFPEDGPVIPLPDDFSGFQTQEVMTDQRVVAVEDEGFRIHGSLPPGQVTLTWAYDLDLSGTSLDFSVAVPFRSYALRVISDAPPGIELDVDGMPRPRLHEQQGHRMLITEVERPDTSLRSFRIRLGGIPGQGPMRWIALGAALILFLAGFLLLMRGGSEAHASASGLARRKRDLLDEALELERMFSNDEIGPKYRDKQMKRVVTELASVLRADKSRNSTASRPKKKQAPAKGAG
jgi:hypothetical protein